MNISTHESISLADQLFDLSGMDVPKSRKILLVDDEKAIRQSLNLYLSRNGFIIDEAENGLQAKERIEENDYFLVFTDITMPHLDGIELLKHIRTLNRDIDVVVVTGHMNIEYAIKAIKKGAFDYLKKPYTLDEVHSTVKRVLEKQTLTRKSIELELLKERQKTQSKSLTEFMIMLANVIDAKSPFTREHSERVSEISVRIATEVGLPDEEIKLIALGAKLHDIGKMGTPDYILNKNGPLTDAEYEVIKQHPGKGAELVQPISFFQGILDIIHFHHENLDGTGYPTGLKGYEIPFHARIVKIADYWDAITSDRPYRKPMSIEKATAIVKEEAKRTMDGDLVKALLSQLTIPHM